MLLDQFSKKVMWQEGSSSLPSFFPFSIPVGSPGKTIPPLSQQKASPASCQNVPLKSEKIWTAAKMSTSRWSSTWKKISVITDISVLRFYGYIGYIGDISADTLEKNIDRLKIVKNSWKCKENFIII